MSLRVRLALAAGVAVALAVIAVTITAYAGTGSELRGQLDSSLTSLAGRITQPGGPGGGPPGSRALGGLFGTSQPASGLSPPGGSQPLQTGGVPQTGGGEPIGVGDEGLALDRRGRGFGAASGIVTLVYRNGGTYTPPTQATRIPVDSRMRQLARSGTGQYFSETTVRGTHLRVLARGIGSRGALAVALPLTDVDRALSDELLLLVGIAAGGIALAALFSVLVARTALAPIARFTGQAEAIAANPERLEHDRLEVTGKDELARLGRTFNTTLDALELSIQSQRNLVADASHELRTPIASVRANLQLLRDEALLSPQDREALRRDMIEELDELTSLVSDIVELARGSRQSGAPADIRLDAVVEEALVRARRRAPGLQFSAELEPTLITGEGERIARAVSNLLDNAAKWSPEAGTIEVTLRNGRVTVRDHGPGFPPEDLPFVFDRFHRARAARAKPGSGLGLAIVRQAAEAHGGSVSAANAPDGGAVVTVSFGELLRLADDEPEPLAPQRAPL